MRNSCEPAGQRPTRRRLQRRDMLWRVGVVTVAAAGGAALLRPDEAKPSGGRYDAEQRFLGLVGGGDGILYAIQADGALLWYRHLGWRNGAMMWANRGRADAIAQGWHRFRQVLAGRDGQFYAVQGDGTMRWYRYLVTDMLTGTGDWHPRSGSVIGSGFDRYPRLFGGPDGVVYGIDADGMLHWHRYLDGADGTGRWQRQPRVHDARFHEYSHFAADDSGVVYAVRFGAMYWLRHLGGRSWAGDGRPRRVGALGDAARKGIVAAGGGTIYVIRPDIGPIPRHDDTIGWFRLTNYDSLADDGHATWARPRLTAVGSGMTVEPMAALQGYLTTPSTVAGGTARIALSTTFDTVTASLVRLAPGDAATPVTEPTPVPGQLQTLPEGYRATGCGWRETVTVPIPAAWPSGVYAARVEGPQGLRRHIPFVVRPAAPTAPFAVVLPTNTYHAYNDWGGHYQYSGDMPRVRRTFTFHRPSTVAQVEPDGMLNHTWYSDLLLLRWMTRNRFGFDCYTDTDLDRSADWLPHYRAVVLPSHSEYWSDRMRAHLAGHLAAGGRLISTGGNTIYERVEFSSDRTALTFRDAAGNRSLWTHRRRPASQLLGTDYTAEGWLTFAPYQVVRDHPLLAGTGLSVGDHFGGTGYNGAASGWEFDTLLGHDGEASPTDVIAEGRNGATGASMVLRDTPAGGWVFNASSVSFNGALATDPALSRLLRNVFTLATRTEPTAASSMAPTPAPSPGN